MLRDQLLSANGCSFCAQITADYGDQIYTFRVKCEFDQLGNMTFTVLAPDSLSGISGKIDENKGALTFEDQVLAFALLADGQVTPVSAPWLVMQSLRSGYIHSSGQDGENLRITIDDSYEADALQVDVWVNADGAPIAADILWQNRRILALTIDSFAYL